MPFPFFVSDLDTRAKLCYTIIMIRTIEKTNCTCKTGCESDCLCNCHRDYPDVLEEYERANNES